MQPPSTPASVSNLVASWDDPERPEATATHGSDERVEPAIAATVVDHAVRRRLTTGRARLVTPPGTFELEQRGPSVDATVVPERSGTGTIELPELPAPTFPSAYELLTEHDVPAAAAPAVEALADAIEEHRPVRELGDRVAAPRDLPRARLRRAAAVATSPSELLRARLVASPSSASTAARTRSRSSCWRRRCRGAARGAAARAGAARRSRRPGLSRPPCADGARHPPTLRSATSRRAIERGLGLVAAMAFAVFLAARRGCRGSPAASCVSDEWLDLTSLRTHAGARLDRRRGERRQPGSDDRSSRGPRREAARRRSRAVGRVTQIDFRKVALARRSGPGSVDRCCSCGRWRPRAGCSRAHAATPVPSASRRSCRRRRAAGGSIRGSPAMRCAPRRATWRCTSSSSARIGSRSPPTTPARARCSSLRRRAAVRRDARVHPPRHRHLAYPLPGMRQVFRIPQRYTAGFRNRPAARSFATCVATAGRSRVEAGLAQLRGVAARSGGRPSASAAAGSGRRPGPRRPAAPTTCAASPPTCSAPSGHRPRPPARRPPRPRLPDGPRTVARRARRDRHAVGLSAPRGVPGRLASRACDHAARVGGSATMLPASLRLPAFRRLLAATTLSVTGSTMTFVVLPLVVVAARPDPPRRSRW